MTRVSIYQKTFLRRSQNLAHSGRISGTRLVVHNPLCGDKQVIYININGNIIAEAKFEAEGCLVSQVATDVLLDTVINKPNDSVLKITLLDIEELIQIDLTPSRTKCATLGLNAIQEYLNSR